MTGTGARILAVGAVTAAVGVAVGAFGAHALEARVTPDMLANYETGARYHFYHSLGIIAIGVVALLFEGAGGSTAGDGRVQSALPRLRWAAWLMLAGVVLFSGSLYAMALTGQRWLGAVTPLGGVSFIAGWALLAWAVGNRRDLKRS